MQPKVVNIDRFQIYLVKKNPISFYRVKLRAAFYMKKFCLISSTLSQTFPYSDTDRQLICKRNGINWSCSVCRQDSCMFLMTIEKPLATSFRLSGLRNKALTHDLYKHEPEMPTVNKPTRDVGNVVDMRVIT